MRLDAKEFYKMFIEESMELLDSLEAILIDLNPASVTSKKINSLFRAFYTIKSSSAVFALTAINQFSHQVENYLSKVRANQLPLGQQAVDVLLQTVTCLRAILVAVQINQPINDTKAKKLTQIFADLIKQSEAVTDMLVKDVNSLQMPNHGVDLAILSTMKQAASSAISKTTTVRDDVKFSYA